MKTHLKIKLLAAALIPGAHSVLWAAPTGWIKRALQPVVHAAGDGFAHVQMEKGQRAKVRFPVWWPRAC